MEVRAINKTISSLLQQGKFIIPNFQREFDWDSENIDEFLEDIHETPSDEKYFIGHMVFEGEFEGGDFKVIDGQQRITTITILLCAIRDRFYELNEKPLGDAINSKFIFGKDVDNKDYGILENKMPYPVLQARVQKIPSERDNTIKATKIGEKKIMKAYEKTKSFLNKYSKDDLIDFRNKVLNLETVFVVAKSITDASTIFMTLNATGKDLKPIDIVKYLIFSKYPKDTLLDEPNDTWKKIMENIGGKDKFLNNSFASRYTGASDRKIYKAIVKVLKVISEDETIAVKKFLTDLYEDSKIYVKITKSDISHWKKDEYEIYESLHAIIDIFNIEVAHSFLIALLRGYQENKISKVMILKVLKCMERFHFINNAICSNRSSGLDHFYSKQARTLALEGTKEKKHDILRKFIKVLSDRNPTQEEFDSMFDSKLFYDSKHTKQKPLVQYVLNKLERQQNKNAILTNVSIEHIYPECPKTKKEEDAKWIRNLGNLVLLDRDLNSKIGNAVFEEKKELVLQESKLITTKDVFEKNKKWDYINIEGRNKELKLLLYNSIWD